MDIVITIAAKFIPSLKTKDMHIAARPLSILACEIVSLVPLEKFIDSKEYGDLYCFMHINRALRMVRVVNFNFKICSLIDTTLFVHLVCMCMGILFIVFINFMVYCTIECFSKDCQYHPCFTANMLTIIMTKLTITGNRYFDVDVPWELTSSIASIFVFIFILNTGRATATVFFINYDSHKVSYLHRSNIIKLRHQLFNSPEYLRQGSEEVFKLTWKNCQGYDESTTFLTILSPALHNEILIDVSWPAFQHSKIFRNMELPFLRYISKYVKPQFYMPGEFLIRKNEWKNKMVYVVSGIIQLLSEEDGESPIMSLASGTCIGESSLFVNYRSINTIRCQTFCEFHVLAKKDFVNVFRKFPDKYKALQRVIEERYNYAKITSGLANIAKINFEHNNRQTDVYTIFWLKNTLHRLMSRDAESTYRHEFQNIYLLNEVNEEKIHKLLFTAIYLDMLVITERIQSDIDTIFVRTSFPCILQPVSILIILWEILVVCFTICLAFAIPTYAFIQETSSAWYLPILYIGTIIYWCDLYVQLSTSLRTRQGVYTKFKQIAIARMHSSGFWIDIFSCIPCEVFSCVVLTEITTQMHARMHLNRILKLWRAVRLFRFWEQQFNANIVVIRFVKYTCIMLYLSFMLFSSLYNLQVHQQTRILFFITVQIMTRVALAAERYSSDNFFFMGAHVTCTLMALVFYSSVASACILKNLSLLKIQQVSYDLIMHFKERKLYGRYNTRIIDYLSTQWEDNRCYDFQQQMFSNIYISKAIYSETIDAAIGDTVRSLEFFKNFSNDFILNICGKLELMSFPPNEIIIQAGDISREIIITHVGCCRIINYCGRTSKVVEKSVDLNLLEIVLGVPNNNTCITDTYCRVFKLTYTDFIQTLVRYPHQLARFQEIVGKSADIKQKLMTLSQSINESEWVRTKKRRRCFYHFGYNLKLDSFEEYDYYIPFDRLYPFSWIRFLLQRSTIMPNGRFIFYWEISRSTLAVISTFMHFTMPIIGHYSFLLTMLDMCAVVDLYVRLHVCYYNEDGLLVKHPLNTASHYLRCGFLIDFIAALPTRYFASIEDYTSYYILNSTKLLQLHRYLHFMYYLQTNMIKPASKYLILSYVPLLLVLANICGSYVIFRYCTEHSGHWILNFEENNCGVDALLPYCDIERPITIWRAQWFGLYIATSVMTTTGFQGFPITSDLCINVFIFLSIFGFYLIVIICGYIHVVYTLRPVYLIETQMLIKHLKNFFALANVSYELRTYTIKCYELRWRRMHGQSIYVLMAPFSRCLKSDVLYAYYGHHLYNSSPFKSRKKRFYSNLLLHMKYDVVIKGGYLSTINDIETKTYFLVKGVADILLPDGTKMVTIYAGSMFGNLEDVRYVRVRHSIVAMSHAEVLSIESSKFREILDFHYSIKEEFHALRRIHLTYIPSTVDNVTVMNLSQRSASIVYRSVYFLRAFDPHSKSMLIWKYLTLIFPCYIGILIDLYQFGVYEFSTPTITIQFLCDILFLIQFLLKDRIAYEDDSGNVITDLRSIKSHNRKNKPMLWITLISILPLDIMIYLLPLGIHRRNRLFSIFRLNRLLRLSYVYNYFSTKNKKLNINAYITRMLYMVVWITLVLVALSSLLALSACAFQEYNIHPSIQKCSVIEEMTSSQKFRLFTMFLYIVANCFTLSSQHNYHPKGTAHILIFVVVLLIGQVIHVTCICQGFSIMYDMNIEKSRFRGAAERIFYYLNTENISASLRQRVKGYIQLIWSKEEGNNYSELIDTAPRYLQDAILNNAYNHIIAFHPIFKECHPDCLRQIILMLRSRTYFSGDFIQFKGSIDATMYFILQGEVGVLYDEYMHKDDYVQKLTSGESFGVLQGLHHIKPHNYSYKCMKRTLILSLDFNSWEYLLWFFPASRERIFSAAKQYKGL